MVELAEIDKLNFKISFVTLTNSTNLNHYKLISFLPWTLSAREPLGGTVSLDSKTGAFCCLSPSTLSSLLRQYTVAIVAKH